MGGGKGADYHLHGLAHGGPPHTVEKLWPYVEAARKAGLDEMGFAEHDRYLNGLEFGVFAELRRLAPLPVRQGIEIDFHPTRSDLRHIAALPWDYLIGSVHHIGNWAFDAPGEEARFDEWDPDELYLSYFDLVARAARTGFFQIIGHLDLIKIYGHRPTRPVVELAEPALRAIAEAGAAVEVNTAGLFKPVGEIYPSRDLLERCFALGIPVTVSSDAHSPEEVGRAREEGLALVRGVGYTHLATFKGRQLIPVPLDG
ncbi:histidinol-phosphatase HisJ family protein [Thermanaeromonas sp. C210]|uniref:histidinol-phosphatase HisJ family protein n=1 Tax=Thermanaeromonas sp. C210 TaxID=2731925 RepID=UPI00155C1E5C|nr:histidinol-phosphatase HisJ family protein [Thermanaeromonas sp. C210]GFN24105.1 histidinol phosphate phosphatase HisJ [Thermanaeromonas sp. C210]